MILITFYSKSGKKLQFICEGFAYVQKVLNNRSYGWTYL